MDKNVSGVDLEELLKAREELDKERGVETDPNLYSGYDNNRASEDSEQKEGSIEIQNNYEDITNIQNTTTEVSNKSGESQSDEDKELDELLAMLESVSSGEKSKSESNVESVTHVEVEPVVQEETRVENTTCSSRLLHPPGCGYRSGRRPRCQDGRVPYQRPDRYRPDSGHDE